MRQTRRVRQILQTVKNQRAGPLPRAGASRQVGQIGTSAPVFAFFSLCSTQERGTNKGATRRNTRRVPAESRATRLWACAGGVEEFGGSIPTAPAETR